MMTGCAVHKGTCGKMISAADVPALPSRMLYECLHEHLLHLLYLLWDHLWCTSANLFELPIMTKGLPDTPHGRTRGARPAQARRPARRGGCVNQ